MMDETLLRVDLNTFDGLPMNIKVVDLNIPKEQKTMILLCSLPERRCVFLVRIA